MLNKEQSIFFFFLVKEEIQGAKINTKTPKKKVANLLTFPIIDGLISVAFVRDEA